MIAWIRQKLAFWFPAVGESGHPSSAESWYMRICADNTSGETLWPKNYTKTYGREIVPTC